MYVTILILVDGFLQSNIKYEKRLFWETVTILILVDGFLQLRVLRIYKSR